jgi:hypothetical protein
MNATAIVTFPDPERAFNALEALEASSGSMARGSIVVSKNLNENLLVTETTREKIGGTIARTFIGALAGLPLGAAAAILSAGALIGAAADCASSFSPRAGAEGQSRWSKEKLLEMKHGKLVFYGAQTRCVVIACGLTYFRSEDE